MELKIGNYYKLIVAAKDQNGVTISNLSTVSAVKYMLKKNKLDADTDAIVTKDLLDGLSVDDPVTGSISVELVADDTIDVDPGDYFQAIQVEYSDDNQQEIKIKENGKVIDHITLIQDIIR